MHPQQPTDLASIAHAMQWFVNYSMARFLPETILVVGFLLAILVDLFIRNPRLKQYSAYFAILVLVLAGGAAAMQWKVFDPANSAQWKPGELIFPYTQTLFAPQVTQGVMQSNYSMAAVDNFSVFFKLIVSLAGILVILMSMASRELRLRERRFGEYYALILGMSIGMYLMPASTDLLMMYLSLELVSIAGYVLAGFSKDRIRGSEAALKYVLFGALSSGLMLYGFSLFYGLTGTTNIIAIRQIFSMGMAGAGMHGAMPNQVVLWLATILSLAGMGYKISAVPFHFWTPDIYEGAPTPITALLSVASKAAGFGLLLRFVLFMFPMMPSTGMPMVNWPVMIAILATITMTLGNLAALLQTNVKRMLAYSSIAHAGYMLVGVVVAGLQVNSIGQGRGLGDAGIVSILIYLATYLFMNLGAFYVVMLLENKLGSEEIDDYRGISQRSPLLASGLALFLISLTGIPLTAGFIGKFYLFTAVLQENPHTHNVPWLWLAIVTMLNSLISLYYYLRVIGAMFVKRPFRDLALEHVEGGATITGDTLVCGLPAKILLFALMIPVVALGIYFQPLVNFASGVIRFFNFQVY